MTDLDVEEAEILEALTRVWLGSEYAEAEVEILEVEVLREERPSILDVIFVTGGRTGQMVMGIRRPGDETRLLRLGDDPALGLYDDDQGLGMAFDAMRDAELAPMVLEAVASELADAGAPAPVGDDDEATVVSFGDQCVLTVFPWIGEGKHPGLEMLVGLDEAGFNHVPAPLSIWRREGRDLGFVQELLAGTAGGWALALTSLRDLYASGGPPESVGGDFASEARAVGTMTARMHLALDKAFGRQSGEVGEWARGIAEVVEANPDRSTLLVDEAAARAALTELGPSTYRVPTIRTHGDFHLGRTARCDQGWIVADCSPGGVLDGSRPTFRSPLCDVADMLWSLHHVAAVAASERDPTGRVGLAPLAQAWEARNRRAFLSGYLATAGIGGLIPPDRDLVTNLSAMFELERAATRTL